MFEISDNPLRAEKAIKDNFFLHGIANYTYGYDTLLFIGYRIIS